MTHKRIPLPSHLRADQGRLIRNDLEPNTVHIFTDGSAGRLNRGSKKAVNTGGWGAHLRFNDTVKNLSGGVVGKKGKTGRMEMQAIASAIEALKKPITLPVFIYSDSQYCVMSLSIWWKGWSRNGWKTASGTPVQHQDLIEQIVSVAYNGSDQIISFRWIKGHIGVPGNELADTLATEARQKAIKEYVKEQENGQHR